MKQKTFKERLEAGLRRDGFKQETSTTKKYTTWSRSNMRDLVFVGKAGALRVGVCATQSRSICEPSCYTWCKDRDRWTSGAKVYKRLLELGDAQLYIEARTIPGMEAKAGTLMEAGIQQSSNHGECNPKGWDAV